jgi:16S rRNA (cytosine967-C5)-methyltransferase
VREREGNDVRMAQDNRRKNLGSRAAALAAVMGVVEKAVPLDVGLDGNDDFQRLEARDRGFARAIASATVRQSGALNAALGVLIEKPLPHQAVKARMMLLCGAAELLVLGSAPHAVVDAWVSLMDQDPDTQRYKNLTNAVLRRVKDQGKQAFEEADPLHDLPEWWADRWVETYGEDDARAIMRARSGPPPLDITTKPDVDLEALAKELEAEILPTGTLRRTEMGAVDSLPGFDRGDWWVQDAAAALPAKLLNPQAGETILDLCAAPGGKTMQLAAAGANVIAVDASPKRVRRLEDNLKRTGLSAICLAADAIEYRPDELVDAILLDAPCTASGTLRRRPDASFIKQPGDVNSLMSIQANILNAAIEMLKPGGRLVYCTCSLEPEEGEHQIAKLLDARMDVRLDPVEADELPELANAILLDGTVRTRPDTWADKGGLDGFFIARLTKV